MQLRHRLLPVAALLCGLASLLHAEAPSLWETAAGRSGQVIEVEAGRAIAFDAGRRVPVPADARWDLRGDLAQGMDLAEWSPNYSIVRTPGAAAGGAVGTAKVSVGRDASGPGLLPVLWPNLAEHPALLIVAWVVDGKATQTKVLHLPVGAARTKEGVPADFSFALTEPEMGGRPGVFLLSKDAFAKPVPRFAEMPLEAAYHACLLGRDEDLAALLSAGLPVSKPDRHGMTLLALLAEAGATRCMPALLKAEAQAAALSDKGGFTPLHHAARNGREHALLLLAQAGGPADAAPLELAARRGHAGCVRILANSSEILDTKRRIELVAGALDRGDFAVAKALLEGASKEVLRSAPVMVAFGGACADGDLARVRMLVAAGCEPQAFRAEGGRGALHIAVGAGSAELLAFLIKSGADANLADRQGRTPLQLALELRKAPLARALLEAGSQPGPGMLHQAVELGSSELVALLVRSGVDAGEVNGQGFTPLDLALELGQKACALSLLYAGQQVTAQSAGMEARLEAIFRLDLAPALKSLLKQGWDADFRLAGGWSTLAVADLMKAPKCAALLREAEVREAGGLPCELVPTAELDTRLKFSTPIAVEDPRPREEIFPRQNVVADLVVDFDGRPRFVRIRNCSDARLERAVLKALQAARYQPPLRAGKPVGVGTSVTVTIPSSRERVLVPAR